jgi:peptidoglycan hydrolase-like protein with peptidoglycan-binding domain
MALNINALKLPVIKKGSKGSVVNAWQRFLKEAAYPVGAVDGDFGNLTDTATRSYQQRNGLPVNGVVDNTTYAKALNQGFIFKVPNFSSGMLLNYIRNYFPTSRSISDLVSPFREKVQRFQQAMINAGVQTIVTATYRPPERAIARSLAAIN